MKKLVTKFVVIVFLAIVRTEGKSKCYVCGHTENYEPSEVHVKWLDTSCAFENKPKPEFSINCEDLEYLEMESGILVGSQKGLGGPTSVNITSIISNSKVTFTCVTIKGERSDSGPKQRTIRTCVLITDVIETFTNECYDEIDTSTEPPWLKSAIFDLKYKWHADSNFGICSCFSDDCNGAESSHFSSASVSAATLLFRNFMLMFLVIQAMCYLLLESS